jgi:hypothetical protein
MTELPDPEKLTPREFAEEVRKQAGVSPKPRFSPRKNWPSTVRPSRGRPYTRCPICNQQVYVLASKKVATGVQMGFASAAALAIHKKARHPEEGNDS